MEIIGALFANYEVLFYATILLVKATVINNDSELYYPSIKVIYLYKKHDVSCVIEKKNCQVDNPDSSIPLIKRSYLYTLDPKILSINETVFDSLE